MYLEGEHFTKNEQKAGELFKKACDMNLDISCEAYNNLKK